MSYSRRRPDFGGFGSEDEPKSKMMKDSNNKSSIEAAQEAIAKVNAMLIAKGKLKPSQLGGVQQKKPGVQSNVITREVDINDVPIGCRNMLTRGATQEEISKLSGAAVATKGRFMNEEAKQRNPREKPLYLLVQATNQDAVSLAVGKISEIIANGMARQNRNRGGYRGFGFPDDMPIQHEKLFIGLEHAPPNFSVKGKLLGSGGSFLKHIQNETGAKITLRGRGSGYKEADTGAEALEPMNILVEHVDQLQLEQAKELALNLIQTVQQEYASFQQSLVFSGPPPPTSMMPPHPMYPPPPGMNLPPKPLLPPGPMTIPPPSLMQNPPIPHSQMIPPTGSPAVVSLAPPGVVIPQLATSSAQHPHGMLPPQHAPQPVYSQQEPPGLPQHQHYQTVQSTGHLSGPPPQQVFVSATGHQPGQVVLTSVQQMPPPQQYSVPLPQQPLPSQQGPPGLSSVGPHHQGSHHGPLLATSPSPGQPMALHGQAPGQPVPQALIQQQVPQGLPPQGLPPQGLPPPGLAHIQQQHALPPPGVAQQPILASSVGQPQPLSQPQMSPTPGQHHMGQPGVYVQQPVSGWGQPAPSYVSPQQVPQQPPLAVQQIYTGQPAPPQGSEVIMSSPQVPMLITSSSVATVMSAPASSYVYKPGPLEEPRRRFTEEKPDDKLPEGLLGYEHGPPHLTNLMVQSSQPQGVGTDPAGHVTGTEPAQSAQVYTSQVPGQPPQYGYSAGPGPPPPQQQQVLVTGALPPVGAAPQPTITVMGQQPLTLPQQPGSQQQQPPPAPQSLQQQPYQQSMAAQLGNMQENRLVEEGIEQPASPAHPPSGSSVSPGPPLPSNSGPAATLEDQKLMPPPPAPFSGVTRDSTADSPGPEHRKKHKGLREEDEDVDIPSSMSSQVKDVKKYQYNQYSSTPQLYTAASTYSSTGGYSQYGAMQYSQAGSEYISVPQPYQPAPPQPSYTVSSPQQPPGYSANSAPAPSGFTTPIYSTYYSTAQTNPSGYVSQPVNSSMASYNPTPMTLTSLPPPPPPPGSAGNGQPHHGEIRVRSPGLTPGMEPGKYAAPSPGLGTDSMTPPPPPPARGFWGY